MSVRNALLSLLDRAPLHGYSLRQEFEAATGSTWPLNVGQVYSTLARLERDGLVVATPSEDEAMRVYAITEAGHDEVRAWFDSPVAPAAPPRDELAIKLAMAVQTPGVDVRAVIQRQRSATLRTLQEYTRAREAAAGELSWLLVADALLFSAEAEIRWLDHCETRLARAAGSRRDRLGGPTTGTSSGAPVVATDTPRGDRAGTATPRAAR